MAENSKIDDLTQAVLSFLIAAPGADDLALSLMACSGKCLTDSDKQYVETYRAERNNLTEKVGAMLDGSEHKEFPND